MPYFIGLYQKKLILQKSNDHVRLFLVLQFIKSRGVRSRIVSILLYRFFHGTTRSNMVFPRKQGFTEPHDRHCLLRSDPLFFGRYIFDPSILVR